ncbi:MAG: c-type cytochrome [Burkholderiales bacterium]
MRIAIAAVLLSLVPASQPLARDAAPPMVQALCSNCHGLDGVAVLPGAANLSGQQQEYLIEQLRAFRSGKRQNPQMNVIAKPLGDRDIEQLSLWYSSIKVTVEMPK